MKRQRMTTYRKTGPYKRTRYAKGTQTNPIVIPDTQVRRALNYRTAGLMGIERKFYDTWKAPAGLVSGNTASAEMDPATLDCLNAPPQGDGGSERDGRQITMENITVKGSVYIPAQAWVAAGENLPSITVHLVLDKQANAATLNSEDVFSNPSGGPDNLCSLFRNMEHISRFNVLKTWKMEASEWGSIAGSATNATGIYKTFTIYHDFKGKKVNFITGTPTAGISAVSDNAVHLIAYANAGTSTPTITYNARMRFRG